MLRTRYIPDCGNFFFVNYNSRMYYQSTATGTCPSLTECLNWGFYTYEPNPNPSSTPLVWGSNVSSLYSPDPYSWGYCCVPYLYNLGSYKYQSTTGDWNNPGDILSYTYEFQSSTNGINNWTSFQIGPSNEVTVSPLLIHFLRVIVTITAVGCDNTVSATSYPIQII